MSKASKGARLIRRWRRMVIAASRKVGGISGLTVLLSRGTTALAFGCLAALLMSAPGCVTTPKTTPLPSAELRASLGQVGVMSVGPALEGTVSGAVGVGQEIGKGALRGGALGGLGGAGTGALLGLGCGPCAPVCVPAFASLGAVGGLVLGSSTGAIYHGVTAIPESTAMQIEASFSKIIADSDIQSDLRMRVTRASGAVVVLDLGMGNAANIAAAPDDDSLFQPRNVDTVLEVAVVRIVLAGQGGRDPSLVLAIKARARLIHVRDNRVLWSDDQFEFKSASAEFSDWTAKDYALLKLQFANGLDAIAHDIAGKVFGPGTSKPAES